MSDNEEVDHLKRRLNWEAPEPLVELSNRASDAATARGQAVISGVRQIAEDRPLTSLVSAFQIGFAVGYWGRRAKR